MMTIPETLVTVHQRPATAAVRSTGPLPPISRELTVDSLSVTASSINSNNNNVVSSLHGFYYADIIASIILSSVAFIQPSQEG